MRRALAPSDRPGALRAAGHTVEEALDGAAALRLTESRPYDVILSDLRMKPFTRERLPGTLRAALDAR